MSGGVTTAPLDGDDLRPWVRELVHNGAYLANQDWSWQLMQDQRERVRDMADWGAPITRDENGEIRRFLSRGMLEIRCMQYNPKKTMEILRRQATERGVTIFDRVSIVELITSDGCYPTSGRVDGAVGFHTREGTFYVFRAKTTVLSTGQMSLKGLHRVDNDTGDGVRMGHNVGGRLVDMEFGFGGTFCVLEATYAFGNYNVAVAHGAKLLNRHGERFIEKYDPVRKERGELRRVVAAYLKELQEGRGPVFIDLRDCDDSYWHDLAFVRGKRGAGVLLSGQVPDPRQHPIAIEPSWSMWNSGRSGLQIDLDCRTNVPGLLASGAAAKNTAAGFHGSAGVPTAFCFTSGYRAGQTAAREAAEQPLPSLRRELVQQLRQRTFAPLDRQQGIEPDEIHDELADIMGRPSTPWCSARPASTTCSGGSTSSTSSSRAPRPTDLHQLVKTHEADSLITCCRLSYGSGRDRTESREFFYREDYPETDDENWFGWHIAQKTPSGTRFELQPIPSSATSSSRPTPHHASARSRPSCGESMTQPTTTDRPLYRGQSSARPGRRSL